MGISQRAAGYGQIASSEANTVDATTAEALVVPAGALSALLTTGAVAIRWRADGTDPTATVGHYIAPNTNMEVFNADMGTFKYIAIATTSVCFISYFSE